MYLFVGAILIIAGCAKDDTLFENQDNLELKKAKVPIPFKGEGWSVPDMESSTKYFIGGTGTHLGKINSKQSYYDFQTQDYIEVDGLPFLDLTGVGKLVGANGDSFEFNFSTRESLIDYNLQGRIDIIPGSGTGKFKGCSGSFDNVGGPDVNGVYFFVFKLEGYLVYN